MHEKYNVFECGIVELAKIRNRAGNITVVENEFHIPFQIKRVYYLYDVPGGESRAGHAHRNLETFVIAASGSFDVLIDDGVTRKTIALNRPNYALHIKQGIWREIHNFSSGAVCLALASELYEEADYIRDYDEFKTYRGA
ncbi:FdtA/QdtA family cupin domain-containing protein [Chitinophaga sedimenti]|uniref:sugar 3,4-ketoisomerase n=1 Tax=Chitinophaga sedimenti TaxID=2033606 RepID=UPI002005482B|nr:FdtA/QdtA family cupin domain-containing protein [Chitinophaga sedimenti]MCK7558115.1 FdtA/QdtA family cupin domain-containing protein [Chitinophaga sedimenti]